MQRIIYWHSNILLNLYISHICYVDVGAAASPRTREVGDAMSAGSGGGLRWAVAALWLPAVTHATTHGNQSKTREAGIEPC